MVSRDARFFVSRNASFESCFDNSGARLSRTPFPFTHSSPNPYSMPDITNHHS